MKTLKTLLVVAAFLAGMAVASCFAHGPHRHYYNHYRQRPNYYSYGIGWGVPYSSPLYYPYNAPTIIVVPERGGWQSGTVYGRPYYRFP